MKKSDLNTFPWLMGLSLFFVIPASFIKEKNVSERVLSEIKVTFRNTVANTPIVLNDSLYTNPFGERYSITKLRYYVTNVSLNNSANNFKEETSYHLIDESKSESHSFAFSLPAGDYNSLEFLLGVDSLHNVSGAQTGDLDPSKDMFWTWNSGYVMVKMEGHSPASNQVNNRYEFHIGGFAGPFNVIKSIKLKKSNNAAINFKPGKTTEIIVNADIGTWWTGASEIKIAKYPVITTPGKNALAISDNYARMFSIDKIISK